MSKNALTHDDALLSLRLYELRREETMRKSRDIVNRRFWPDNLEDLLATFSWTHPFNAALRQTSSYWEMVYGMARNGIIDPDFLLETHGEGLVLFAKVLPYLGEIRQRLGEAAFRNTEWITQNCETGKTRLEALQGRLKMFREMVQQADAGKD